MRFSVSMLSALAIAFAMALQTADCFTPSSSISRSTAARRQRFVSSPLKVFNEEKTQEQTTVTKTSDEDQYDLYNPDPSLLLCSKSPNVQRLGVLGILVLLSLGTYAAIQLVGGISSLLPNALYTFGRDKVVAVPLGAVFAAVGVTHFTYKTEYARIVPPNGTWGGLWRVPAPGREALNLTAEDYHVLWTGVAESLLGIGLLVGGWTDNEFLVRTSAAVLFGLTIAVTPANIYMFTHNVPLSMAPPFEYPSGHIARGVLQCMLLSCFYTVAFA